MEMPPGEVGVAMAPLGSVVGEGSGSTNLRSAWEYPEVVQNFTWQGNVRMESHWAPVPPRAASEQVWCDIEWDTREVAPDLRLVFARGEKCE